VEDNVRSLKLVCELLALRGYPSVTARTGEDAIRLACAESPRLVLMDVQLPDMDGASVLARLRADARTAAIPVVAVTALAMTGDRERLIAQGFDAYVAKPIDVRTFVDELAPLMLADR
jgi:two-component system cell cycle response regulator DivK